LKAHKKVLGKKEKQNKGNKGMEGFKSSESRLVRLFQKGREQWRKRAAEKQNYGDFGQWCKFGRGTDWFSE
ncbi:hypothetical protein QHH11_29195, partial [Aphanizomenon sp. PH219]|nr:hypothetical protein [Aphanizomenon sp. PH219]